MFLNRKFLIYSILIFILIFVFQLKSIKNQTKNYRNNLSIIESIDNSQNRESTSTCSSSTVHKITEPSFSRKIKKSNKWIVVTSINEPSEQLKKLANIADFQLLVIGDLKTNSNWSLDKTEFLSIQDQSTLGFKIYHSIPFNSYTRKNLGYLFAIKHGARFIYDTDDDNAPLVDLNSYFNFNQTDYGLIYDCRIEQNILNPYAHFGQPLIWPRGYPLSEIKNNFNNSYILGKRKTSIVQQALVNGDPDVDAIFRLTKSMGFKKIDIKFDPSSPSIQLPVYKMSPYNSQNTLFSYKAFWSLYLPKTVSSRLCDIWRSYWSQRLMWLLNETITFKAPSAYQLRNTHSYLKDYFQENAMYLQTESLVKFLFDWKCSKIKFYECVIELSEKMAENKFWEASELESIKKWLEDLTQVGYVQPEIVNFENNCIYKFDLFDYTQVRYTPNFQNNLDLDNFCCNQTLNRIYENLEIYNYFETMCNKVEIKLNSSNKEYIDAKRNYSLLVTFNQEPIEENIIIIKHLYSGSFQNLIFCGINLLDKLSDQRGKWKKFDSFTFIEHFTENGNYHYFCMNKAIEMGFNTQGFLLISDDVFLKYWNLDILNANKIWFPFRLEMKYEMKFNPLELWSHWQHSVEELLNTWKYFEIILSEQMKTSEKEKDIIKRFLRTLEKNQDFRTNVTKFLYSGADVFYLPNRKFEDFYFMANIFRMNNVFLEVAVPTLLGGLEDKMSAELLIGNYSWYGEPFDFRSYYEFFHFFHSFKFSIVRNDTQTARHFCQYYLNDKFIYLD